MTSLAFIFGLLPLASLLVGAVGNRSIGMGAVGGVSGYRLGYLFILFVLGYKNVSLEHQ
jgi:HAE1 family hydrophobic/amphiphilic exporter-1